MKVEHRIKKKGELCLSSSINKDGNKTISKSVHVKKGDLSVVAAHAKFGFVESEPNPVMSWSVSTVGRVLSLDEFKEVQVAHEMLLNEIERIDNSKQKQLER